MTMISFKKLFELTADIPAGGQMADAFKKWVPNIASQYCLFISYEAAKQLLGQSFMIPACHGDTVESVSLSY